MPSEELIIDFPDQSRAEATQAAQSLREAILDTAAPEVTDVRIRRSDETSMDAGATLVLVLGTPAAISLARGISAWIKRHNTSVRITKDGEVLLQNIDSKDAPSILAALKRESS